MLPAIPTQLRPMTNFPASPVPCPDCGTETTITGGFRSKTGFCRRRLCDCGNKFSTYQEPGGEERVALRLGEGPQVGDLRRDLVLLMVSHYQLCKAVGIPFRLDEEEWELAERIRGLK